MSKIKSIRVAYAESQTANQKPENLNFSAPYNKRTLIGRNPIGISKKRGKRALSRNQMCPRWIFRLSDLYLRYPILKD